jgi:hypothetical protein
MTTTPLPQEPQRFKLFQHPIIQVPSVWTNKKNQIVVLLDWHHQNSHEVITNQPTAVWLHSTALGTTLSQSIDDVAAYIQNGALTKYNPPK